MTKNDVNRTLFAVFDFACEKAKDEVRKAASSKKITISAKDLEVLLSVIDGNFRTAFSGGHQQILSALGKFESSVKESVMSQKKSR